MRFVALSCNVVCGHTFHTSSISLEMSVRQIEGLPSLQDSVRTRVPHPHVAQHPPPPPACVANTTRNCCGQERAVLHGLLDENRVPGHTLFPPS